MAIAEPPSSEPNAPQRILVVDDEPTIREMLGYNLRRDGFIVETADDGREALAAARRNPPDLVVLDIMLPGLDGFQVCRALRQESHVPILVLSARGEEFDRVHGLELGADDYLTKPFAMRELLARVRSLLRRAQLPLHGWMAGHHPRTAWRAQTDRGGSPRRWSPATSRSTLPGGRRAEAERL
jgi:DNA-binding response OmpR family regulator